jgi:aminoglycoside 3-N-acetyltransferase
LSEADVIARTPEPRTVASLTTDLRALGIEPGITLCVHSSLSALGWVAGGAAAPIHALLDTLGPDGTLVMPAHSGDYSDPARWRNPPVPPAWIGTIRSERPPFDPRRTQTRGMGAIAELFRTWPDVLRSDHPLASFAAHGPNADQITAGHLDELGERSPLARLYDLDAHVLLLGVGHDRNTSLHLAETRCGIVEMDSDRFPELMAGFAGERAGLVGSADTRLMRQRAAVDFAADRLRKNAQIANP